MIIKVCGITNLEDALLSIEHGATALGFNFYPKSPRYITPEAAKKITEKLPDDILTIGIIVMTDAHSGQRSAVSGQLPVDALQIYGLKSEDDIPPTDKLVFIATDPDHVSRFPNHDLVIDTSWGTGKKADWDRLRTIDRSYILSGGLTFDNVMEAIRLLNPAGVDVCSGVESAPGQKDPVKLKHFLDALRDISRDVQAHLRP
ncbi:MAG: phosphoribosylanthranilate isomerase [Acidobacteriota bacterium]